MRIFSKKFISLCLLLAASVYFLLATTLGLRTMIYGISYFLPGKLTMSKLEGRLISHLTCENFLYQSQDAIVSFSILKMQWSLKKLFSGQIFIDQLEMDGFKIALTTKNKTSNNTDWNGSGLYWLKKLVIHHLRINKFLIWQNGQKIVEINTLAIDQQQDRYFISLDSIQGKIKGQYYLKWDSELQWEAALDVSEANLNAYFKDLKTDINFSLVSKGSWKADNKDVLFQLQNLHGQLGQYPIKGVALFAYNNGELDIQKVSVELAAAFAKLSGRIGKQWDIAWQVNVPELKAVIPKADGDFASEGKIVGTRDKLNINAQLSGKKISLDDVKIDILEATVNSKLTDQTANAALFVKRLNIMGYQIPELNLKIASRTSKADLISYVDIALSEKTKAAGEIVLTKFKAISDLNQFIKGKLIVTCHNLDDLIVIPEVSNMQGSLRGDIALSGKLTNPLFLIHAAIDQGQLFIPKLKIYLKDIQLQGEFQSGQPINFSGNFAAGEGRGKLSGVFNPEKIGLPVELSLEGENLLVANLPEYKITISPKLAIYYSDLKTKIKGSLHVPYAHVTPKDFSNVATLPQETIIVGQKATEQNSPNNLSMKVQVVLGDDIFLSYANLQTKLKGNILISEKFGGPPMGSGELHTVNGRYQAYGRSLEIKQGRLIYAGNLLTNPGLDIRASKEFEILSFAEDQSQFASDHQFKSVYQGSGKLTAGIWVKGTLNSPYLSFFSDPTGINQNDILSYLVFGYPRSKIKDMGSLAILNNIASGLNTGSSKVEKVTDKMQKIFGLTDLSLGTVETFDPDDNKSKMNTTVNIGKKFGRKFSIHYRMGVFNPVSVLNLKYQINKRLAIQSEASSLDTGADLLFEYERD